MTIKAMNSKDLTFLLNSIRPGHAPLVLVGNVNAKIRGMNESKMLSGISDIPERGSEIFLTADDVETVLMSYRQYGVPEQVRKMMGLAPTAFAPLADASPRMPSAVVSVPVETLVPATLAVQEGADGVKTMSSLDMVAYINATRAPGKPELRHDHFMTKVPTVIKDAPKFRDIYFDAMSRQQAMYRFPRREAMLMAMSYSYELQATVFDSWEAAEAKLAAQAPSVVSIPTTYLDALKQLVASVEVNQQQTAQIAQQTVMLEEAAPKVEFHDAVVASDEEYYVGEAAKTLGVEVNFFFDWLRANGYMFKNSTLPKSTASAYLVPRMGGFEYAPGKFSKPTPRVTGAGMVYFRAKLVKEGKIKA